MARRLVECGGTLILQLVLVFSFALSIHAQQWDWVKRFPGHGSIVTSIALDAEENVYVAGTFGGTNQIGTNTFISEEVASI